MSKKTDKKEPKKSTRKSVTKKSLASRLSETGVLPVMEIVSPRNVMYSSRRISAPITWEQLLEYTPADQEKIALGLRRMEMAMEKVDEKHPLTIGTVRQEAVQRSDAVEKTQKVHSYQDVMGKSVEEQKRILDDFFTEDPNLKAECEARSEELGEMIDVYSAALVVLREKGQTVVEIQKVRDLSANSGFSRFEGIISAVGQIKQFDNKGSPGMRQTFSIADGAGGSIDGTFWTDHAGKFKVGDEIAFTKGYVKEFKGKLQISTGQWGKIEKKNDAGEWEEV